MKFIKPITAISAVMLLAAPSSSYAAGPTPDIKCDSSNAEHADTGLKLKTISPVWRATVFTPGIKGCNQVLYEFSAEAPAGSNVQMFTTKAAEIISVPGATPCDADAAWNKVPSHHPKRMGTATVAGKLELYCFNRAAVNGKTGIYRYANIVVWNNEAGSQPYGAGYFVGGADSATPGFRGIGADPFANYGNVQIILTPEKN
jgi:hypothetical protein